MYSVASMSHVAVTLGFARAESCVLIVLTRELPLSEDLRMWKGTDERQVSNLPWWK